MHTKVALFNTEAEVNLIHSAYIPPGRINSVKKDAQPRLRKATKEPLQVDGVTVLQLRLGDLCRRPWFTIAPKLSGNVLIGTAYIDGFILKISPTERKEVI